MTNMQPFTCLTAVAAPLIRANVDTDAIIPSREMRSVGKSGLSDGLFAGWRYASIGGRDPNPDFILNQPAYDGARFLLAGDNFGCGSSREHAAWALAEYGFRAILAPSFNPIFEGNCIRNGIVPVRLKLPDIEGLAAMIASDPQNLRLTIDLEAREVRPPKGAALSFNLPEEARDMLLYGLDAIDLTLQRKSDIEAFIQQDRSARPWVYL